MFQCWLELNLCDHSYTIIMFHSLDHFFLDGIQFLKNTYTYIMCVLISALTNIERVIESFGIKEGQRRSVIRVDILEARLYRDNGVCYKRSTERAAHHHCHYITCPSFRWVFLHIQYINGDVQSYFIIYSMTFNLNYTNFIPNYLWGWDVNETRSLGFELWERGIHDKFWYVILNEWSKKFVVRPKKKNHTLFWPSFKWLALIEWY